MRVFMRVMQRNNVVGIITVLLLYSIRSIRIQVRGLIMTSILAIQSSVSSGSQRLLRKEELSVQYFIAQISQT